MSTIDPELFFKQEATRRAEYWEQLRHLATIAAMQGILSNANHALWDRENNAEGIAKSASAIAHALVEEARYKENPKELEGLKKELEALKIEKTILENKIKLLTEERK